MKKTNLFMLVLMMTTFTLTTQKLNAMEKKKVEKTPVLMYTMKATLATIAEAPGAIPDELVTKANELGLEIAGPQIWQYRNVDGNPNSQFDLDICLPVNEMKGDPGKFQFEVLPEITCISEIHKGSWSKLSNTYNRLMGEMTRKGIVPGNMSREIYHVCDFENEENCITEVQMLFNQ